MNDAPTSPEQEAAAAQPRICSEFVEREARKLCLAHSGWKADTMVAWHALPVGPMGKPVMDWTTVRPAWHLYVPWVRMVLEGLKAPTEEMLDAVCEFTPGDPARRQGAEYTLRDVADAALAIPQQPPAAQAGSYIPVELRTGETWQQALDRTMSEIKGKGA